MRNLVEQGAINTAPTFSRNLCLELLVQFTNSEMSNNIHPHRTIIFTLGPCFGPLVLRLSEKLHGICIEWLGMTYFLTPKLISKTH